MELETLAEIQRDDVAVETSACELQGLFVHGSQSKNVVLCRERIQSRILKGIRESERYATSDFELWGEILVWERIWYGAGLTWLVGVARGLHIDTHKLVRQLSGHAMV